MGEPVQAFRCAIALESVDAFRSGFVARLPGCFIPFPDDVPAFSWIDIDLTFDDARLEVRGRVVGSDFDENGNIGLSVELDAESVLVVRQLDDQLKGGTSAPALFSTTRIRIDPALTPSPSPRITVPFPPEGGELLREGQLVDGRFRIERHLATGGMGEVYRAEHIHLKRPVALKLLRRELSTDPEMWGRFEREAQLVSQLENPHVVRVFDFGRTGDGQLFLAMEFVEGETLDKRLQQGPIAPARAVEILTQVLDGLAEAHNLGVVHRDLKPPNIMLGARREGGERAKILDFGIARLSDASASPERAKLTQVGVVVGTPAYLAPEQALADELDHRTDIYAMGCVAYEVLTGTPPFSGKDLRKVIAQHLTAAPVNPSNVRAELVRFPLLCAAVLKALAKEKEHRFQNVTEFREALRLSISTPNQEVSISQLVPEQSTPWPPPPPEWDAAPPPAAPPPTIAPVTPGELVPQDGEEIITGTTSTGLADRVPESILIRLARPPSAPTEVVLVRVEILGPDSNGVPFLTCVAHVTDIMVRASAFLATSDDESLTFGFVAASGSPAGRAAQSLVSAREALAWQSTQLKVSATLRGLATASRFPSPKELTETGRLRLAKARANTVWMDQRLAPAVNRVCEVGATPESGMVALGPRKPRSRSTAELIARKPLVDAFERRLASLAQGVGAPLVISGPSGSGHTSLSTLLTASAKKKGALAVMSSGLDVPGGALIELMCSALGVEVHEREKKFAAALEPLPLVDTARRAALTLAGLNPMPTAFTPGQAAHAVRVVLRAAAIDRPVVVIADGLHNFDQLSRDTFFAMAGRPASREQLIGFATPECVSGQEGLQIVALAPLSKAETQRLVTVTCGVVAGPTLTDYVHTRGEGVPARTLEVLTWLDERGALFSDANGALELAEPEAVLPPDLAVGLLEAMPLAQRQALAAAAFLGDRFDPAVLTEVVPAADVVQQQHLQSSGFLVVESAKRARIRDQALRRRLAQGRGGEADSLRKRCAEVLIARGRVDASAVEPVHLAQLLTDANEGVRAAPLWKHAVEQATVRRDFRASKIAWTGLSRALGTVPQPDAQSRIRLEALTRAAAHAVLLDELADARALLNEAGVLAPGVQPPSAEYLMLEARVLRLEGRRVKAAEVLGMAEAVSQGSPVNALVLAERAEAREVEGDLDGAMAAFEQALVGAPAVADFARWHGEIELHARLETRLATICFARRDVGKAKSLLESALVRWRKANWVWAEARVLSTLGTVLVFMQQYSPAAAAYEAAGVTAARGGDLQFQARAMIQQAKAIRKQQGQSASMKNVALEARKLCLALSWEQGRLDASALIET